LAIQDLADLTEDDISTFWAQVKDRSTVLNEWGQQPCWEWLGSESQGKGLFSFEAKGRRDYVFAHHAAWHIRIGTLLPGQLLFRLCSSDFICVNPAHQELRGTPHPTNGRLPTRGIPEEWLFTQGDLNNIRAMAERTAIARDVAKAADIKLTPAENYLITLAELIVAALPEDTFHSYKIVAPEKSEK